MKSTRFSFSNKDGFTLSAQMEWPADQKPYGFSIFAHCFTCGKNLTTVRTITKALASRGYAVLSFDFTGLGQSDGEFADSNFSGNVEDVIAAAQFLEKEFSAPLLLIGHSLGGAAIIKAALQLPSVKAIATIAAPSQVSHVRKLFQSDLAKIESVGSAKVDLGGRSFLIKKQFVDDLINHTITQTLGELSKALLILHSPQDTVVNITNASELYQFAHHPKSFVSLDGADHLLSNKTDAQYTGEVIAAWAQRYVQVQETLSLDSEYQTVALIGEKEGAFTTLIKTGKHFITADEPEDVGGNDFGPSPYQLLTSALAACTVMTLRMYANRKELNIKEIKVHVSHSKRHCEDCDITNSNSRIDHFERMVEVDGELDGAQLTKLLEIADKCPVHKTLLGEIKIDTTLKRN